VGRHVVVIGDGPAAVASAVAARKTDPEADIKLVGQERHEPYEKPPLSKAVLRGTAIPADNLILGEGGLASQRISVVEATCTALDRAEREAMTNEGPVPYDALVIATGSLPLELAVLPMLMPRVHYLRAAADATALRIDLAHCEHLVVVGGGLIGLEVAASATELGIRTTIVEAAGQIMSRVCDAQTADFVTDRHRTRGVDVRLGVSVTRASQEPDGRISLETSAETLLADVVVVGIGAAPSDALAREAGLTTDRGIVVDSHCRTDDPDVYAAGDVTRLGRPDGSVRLENWRHALEQGAVAGENAAGGDAEYDPMPSFWSEQFDMDIQAVGWPDVLAQTRVCRRRSADDLMVLGLANGEVCSAIAINQGRDISVARRLIQRHVQVDAEQLADSEVPLQSFLAGRT
jgi:3-phenylpropionate/trans-cinnamate dioxygenase ferredoxin reductase component